MKSLIFLRLFHFYSEVSAAFLSYVTGDISWLQQKTFCENNGKSLCTYDVLCPGRKRGGSFFGEPACGTTEPDVSFIAVATDGFCPGSTSTVMLLSSSLIICWSLACPYLCRDCLS